MVNNVDWNVNNLTCPTIKMIELFLFSKCCVCSGYTAKQQTQEGVEKAREKSRW